MTESKTTLEYGGIKIVTDENCSDDTVYLMALSDEQIKKAIEYGIDVKKIDPKQIVMVHNAKYD